MTELLIYCFFGLVFLLFFVLLPSKPKRHNWHEVSSSDLALASRKRKNPKSRR